MCSIQQSLTVFQSVPLHRGKFGTDYEIAHNCRMLWKRWQPIRGGVYNSLLIFEYQPNSCNVSALRFNPVQIGEWLDDLLRREIVTTRAALSQYVGMSRTRVGQFLALAGLPAGTRAKLRGMPDLTEYQTRQLLAERSAPLALN